MRQHRARPHLLRPTPAHRLSVVASNSSRYQELTEQRFECAMSNRSNRECRTYTPPWPYTSSTFNSWFLGVVRYAIPLIRQLSRWSVQTGFPKSDGKGAAPLRYSTDSWSTQYHCAYLAASAQYIFQGAPRMQESASLDLRMVSPWQRWLHAFAVFVLHMAPHTRPPNIARCSRTTNCSLKVLRRRFVVSCKAI